MFKQANKDLGSKPNRRHCRLPMSMPLSLEMGDHGTMMTVQNHDISWGGVRFAVPRHALGDLRTVTVMFPWANGTQFQASAEIVRTEVLDDEHDLIAARFRNLSAKDQRRLEKLLRMLQGTPDDHNGDRVTPLAPVLEILMADADEIRDKLTELAEGWMRVTVVERYDLNQSIHLILSDTTQHSPLHLRARVAGVSELSLDSDSAWSLFDLHLEFEHPVAELKKAAETWLKGLPKQLLASSEAPREDALTEGANPYLVH